MATSTRRVLGIGIVLVIGASFAYVGARYLVSRLDGTGGVYAPAQTLEQYSSEDGVMFQYPDTYQLSSRTDGNAERTWDVLVLLPRGYEAAQYTEGPPAISMGVFQNPEGLSLEQWVRGDARSNFKLGDGSLTPGVVGGEPALFYAHTGLYETDAVAVAHGGKVFLFEAGWMGASDPIRADFQNLIKTVQFTS